MEAPFVVVGLFLLRLGVPLLITLLVAYWFRRLDKKWQAEALARKPLGSWQGNPRSKLESLKPEQPCWVTKGCAEKDRAQCPGCSPLDIPCWVKQIRATGELPRKCYGCELFNLQPA